MRARLSIASVLLAGTLAPAQSPVPVHPVPYPFNVKPTTPQATLTGVPAAPAKPPQFTVLEAPPGVQHLRFAMPGVLPLPGPLAPTMNAMPFSICVPSPSTKPKTKVFEVADLVAAPLAIPGAASLENTKATAGHTLVKFFTAFAKPESWERRGGAGTIEFIEASESLCITNTPEVLGEVEKLLAGLRRLNDQQVSVEYRLITASPECSAGWSKPDELGKTAAKFWSTAELVKHLEGCAADRRTTVLQAPKLTIVDGQSGLIELGDRVPATESLQCVGFHADDAMLRIQCLPTISADAKSVRIKTNTEITRPGNRTHAASTAMLPDGHSMVQYLGKQTTTETIEQCGVPVLATVPYLNRLFKTVGIRTVEREVYQITTVRILKPVAKKSLRLEIHLGE